MEKPNHAKPPPTHPDLQHKLCNEDQNLLYTTQQGGEGLGMGLGQFNPWRSSFRVPAWGWRSRQQAGRWSPWCTKSWTQQNGEGLWNLLTLLKSRGLEGCGVVGPRSSWGSPFLPSFAPPSLGEKSQRRVLGENAGPTRAPPGCQGDWESGGLTFLSVGV